MARAGHWVLQSMAYTDFAWLNRFIVCILQVYVWVTPWSHWTCSQQLMLSDSHLVCFVNLKVTAQQKNSKIKAALQHELLSMVTNHPEVKEVESLLVSILD